MADHPSDLRYTKDHEWAHVEGGRVRVGITRHAVDQLGDITLVNVDVPVGGAVEAGKAFGTVESVKAVSDLFAPISGKLIEVNSALTNNPELVNEDPYAKGWMVIIESTSGAAADLMDAAAYSSYVATLDH
jgi:glycine cleavage system H protein